MRNLILFTALLLLLLPQVQSQTSTVILSGTVQDPSGTAVPGHRVTYWASDFTTFFNKFGNLYSDANGNFSDTIQYPTSNNLKIRVSYDSCGRYRRRDFNNVTTNLTLNLTVCPPPCSTQFAYTRDTSGLYHFQALDTSLTSYSWNFGNGYTTGSHQASYQFPSGGFYQVCLATARGTCVDTTCRNVFVSILPPPPPTCSAAFTYSRDTAGIVHFRALDTTYTSYSWDFGSGYSATGHRVSNQFTSSGRYRICLAVANGTCVDTFCRNVFVVVPPPPPACNSRFTYTRDTAGIVHFQALDTSLTSYSWNFGSGYSATGYQVSNQFTSSGIYQVCLAVANGTCADTSCKYVVVNIPVPPPPRCRAVFSYRRDTAGLVHFNALDTSYSSYSWDFGNGYTTGSYQASYQFTANGSYTVCLATANGSCADTFCKRIRIYIPPPPPPQCRATFYYRQDTSGLYHFWARDTSFTGYSWNFGNGYTSGGYHVSHQFSSPGAVKVCLATANGTCADTFCRSVTVRIQAPQCRASFSLRRDTAGIVHFRALDTSYTSYSWDFGDGATASGHSPSHQYAKSGIFRVCLKTQNGPCADSVCKPIFIRLPGHVPLYGRVYRDRNYAQAYQVFLIVHDSAAGTLTAVDTFENNGSAYGTFFFWTTPGDYLVKAALTPSDSKYTDYLPTYYGDSLNWYDATVVSTSMRPYLRINLVPGVNPGGPGFVGGLISQGANRQGEISGVGAAKDAATYGEQTATSITDLSGNAASIQVYPNPVEDRLFVAMDLKQSAKVEMALSNALGQQLAFKSDFYSQGPQKIEWPLELPAGVYFLQVRMDGKPALVQRLILR